MLIEHPKVVFSQVLKGLKWKDGNVYEDHQDTHLYIVPAEIFQEIRMELRSGIQSEKKLQGTCFITSINQARNR